MTLQFMRKFRLTVQIAKGQPQALDLSDFYFRFRVSQPTAEQPKTAEIYVYNLSLNTVNLLAGKEDQNKDTQVILEFAYGTDDFETVFKGAAFQFRRGRDSATDTWLCILAQCGDFVKNFALVNDSIPAGTSVNDVQDFFIKQYNSNGIDTGEVPTLTGQRYPRGRVFFGQLDYHVNRFCKENNITFDVTDDLFNAVPIGGYSQMPMQILTPKTGMVGMPQLTSEGVRVSCLLNPKMKRGGRVQIDMTNLQTEAYDTTYRQQGNDQPFKNQKLATNADGTFAIVSVEHYGESRGQDCTTDLICVGIGAVVPLSGVSITGVNG